MNEKIKQFFFYVSYELSLFQKIIALLLAVAVFGYLGIQGTKVVGGLVSGALVKTSVTEEAGGSAGLVATIVSVDAARRLEDGTITVRYALSQKPEGAYTFTLRAEDSNQGEIAVVAQQSEEQSGTLELKLPEGRRNEAAPTLRLTVDGGGQSASDSITITFGSSLTGSGSIVAPLDEGTGAAEPTPTPNPEPPAVTPPMTPNPTPNTPGNGSGTTLPPGFSGPRGTDIPATGSGARLPGGNIPTPPPVENQCRSTGQSCQTDGDCCSQRCSAVGANEPRPSICLPKRK